MYLGVDVGFSKKVRSTGVCVIVPSDDSPVRSVHVRTQETFDAINALVSGAVPVAASIDGPLVPGKLATARFTTVNRYRGCERMLSGGIFQKRCKPGPTNSPRGLALHRQATAVANHLLKIFPSIVIEEAFPNAFMGVMLPDAVFGAPIRRGIKSDVFWERCVTEPSLMRQLLEHLFPRKIARKIFERGAMLADHDERAAFVCAVVARGAEMKANFLVGDGDGKISLPPNRFVQKWAREVLVARGCDGTAFRP